MPMTPPRFSVVIPVYNRAQHIVRAVDSCLAQAEADFEVVVVDDGSTDGTAGVVARVRDERVRLLRLAENRGEGVARNTGAEAARGEWIVLLDSDDELLPGALARMREAAGRVDSSIAQLCFSYRRDDGRKTPDPPPAQSVMDYAAFIAWQESLQRYDFLACLRRCTFNQVRFPTVRWHALIRYRFDFAARFRSQFCGETLAVVHQDANDRVSFQVRSAAVASRRAREMGAALDAILTHHDAVLARNAPRQHQRFLRLRASYHFLAGQRRAGLRQMSRCLLATPLSAEAWALLLLGLTGRSLFARARALRRPRT